MAEPKRYYWMKLKDSFMTSDTIDYFMSQPDGANYVVLYQMLCLKTINTAGRLSRQIGELIIPYDVDKIHRDCKWFSVDTIRVALKLYQAVGLIYEDVDGTLVMTDHKNLVGSEADSAARVRAHRENKKKSLQSGSVQALPDVTPPLQCNNIVTPEKEIRERDKSIEIDKESKREKPADKPPEPAPKSFDFSTTSFSPAMIEAVENWLKYKKERRETYKPTGLKSLITEIQNNVNQYGERAVIDLIHTCMASNWRGIIFDRLKQQPKSQPYHSRSDNGFQTSNPFMEMYEERRGHG